MGLCKSCQSIRTNESARVLCAWCDEPADGVVKYAGEDHPACISHIRWNAEPITYANQDFDRINSAKRA